MLEKEISRAQRDQMPIAVVMIDLDHFKLVNDTYGHLVGDEVLRNVAERMTGTVREYDYVGRYGGEEFLVVLPNCTAETAREVAERLRQHIGDRPIVTSPTQVVITISIGVSQWQPGQEVHDLLRSADAAMYRAKQSGRNRVVMDDAGAADC
jgi:diguanylate cyclase (GGDEF)-like protein